MMRKKDIWKIASGNLGRLLGVEARVDALERTASKSIPEEQMTTVREVLRRQMWQMDELVRSKAAPYGEFEKAAALVAAMVKIAEVLGLDEKVRDSGAIEEAGR